MPQFQAGDTVRIREDALALGWLKPGQVGEVTRVVGDVLIFEDPDGEYATQSRYYLYEVEPYEPPRKRPTNGDIDLLLKKARKVQAVYADPNSELHDYLKALGKFEKAVVEVMNK